MKVILMEDISTLGRMGDTVSVKDGYARNYLIPRRLAVPATPRNIKEQEHNLRTIERKRDSALAGARTLADRLHGAHVTFTRKAGETGRLFGSVTNIDIAEALAEQGIEVDRKDIVVQDPIKVLGDFEVAVKLHQDVPATVKVTVAGEDIETSPVIGTEKSE